jgi:hypothetical protein
MEEVQRYIVNMGDHAARKSLFLLNPVHILTLY